jgi:multidrug efflux pump subunit AcrA (membrane-fusion protein)
VISVAPQIDSVTKAYPVEIELVNEEGLIKGGMYAEVGLIVEQKNDVLRIPQNAVLKEGQDKIVFVAEADQAVLRKVETGLAIGDMVEIKAGLLGGESLIVEGQYAVREGSMLKVTPRGTAQ